MAAVVAPQVDQDRDGSGRLYRLIAETVPHMVWTARADGYVDFFNRRCYEYTGLDAEAMSGWDWRAVIHPEDCERALAAWTRALQTGERFEVEYRLRRADGAFRWYQGTAVPLRDAEGHVTRWFGTCTDIELQVQGARILESVVDERTRALRAAQQRLGAIIEAEPECVKLLDADGRLLEMNSAGLRMIEAAGLAEVAGHCVYGLVAEEHRDAFRALTERVCAGSRGTLEFELVGLRGTRRWMETHAVPFVDEMSGATRLLAITRDVTESKRAGQALAESERRARALVGRLIDAQESERRRLADELHDLIGQNLTALGIDLAALRARLPESGDAARLEAMRALVESTISAIRGVMTGLRPPALEEFGLVPAVRAHAAEFARRTGIAVEVLAAGGAARLAAGAELALFRIVQEALTNAAKHSGGRSVRIRFATHAGRVELSVEDDGAGFEQPNGAREARRGGWGLPEMRERAEAHGGALRVASSAGGTRVTVEIPIKVS